jgi:hypothetical protein
MRMAMLFWNIKIENIVSVLGNTYDRKVLRPFNEYSLSNFITIRSLFKQPVLRIAGSRPVHSAKFYKVCKSIIYNFFSIFSNGTEPYPFINQKLSNSEIKRFLIFRSIKNQ